MTISFSAGRGVKRDKMRYSEDGVISGQKELCTEEPRGLDGL